MNELDPGYGAPVAPKPPRENLAPPSEPLAAEPVEGAEAPPPLSGLAGHLQARTEGALERFEKLQEAVGRLRVVRQEMDKLLGLGDMVSEDDVVGAAAGLVAGGLTAPAVAGLLADMPTAPEAIKEWVAQHDQGVRAREAQLEQVMRLARHELAVSGLRQLIGHAALAHAREQRGGI